MSLKLSYIELGNFVSLQSGTMNTFSGDNHRAEMSKLFLLHKLQYTDSRPYTVKARLFHVKKNIPLKTLITPAVVPKRHTLFDMIFWNNCACNCAKQYWILNTLRGDGFDCFLTLISIMMEHPGPLHVCTNVCIIFAHTGAGVIRVAVQGQV